ncbi:MULTISPECIES: hypothetical protein [Nitrosospira]|uniref:hypothetical protein n=1 Tax=Nitrosospira TaxID=35798 RepID=UPI000941CF7D|nr:MULTISPECIES: hypothetical protein [Nitrosospira]
MGENQVRKFGLKAGLATMTAMVLFVHVEARAQAQPGLGIDPGQGTQAAAQAAAVAGALSSSHQTQTSITTATGGQGGMAYNTGNSQTVSLGIHDVRNNPNIGLGLMVPTAPCRDTYSLGGSAAGVGGGVAWSKADRECRWQDIGTAFIRAGFIEDGLAMWCAIEGVEDIAPTCKRLKAAKQVVRDSAGTSNDISRQGEWQGW